MKLVAVTNCSVGIAHTYMAAESLEKAAKEAGVEIKVETQGTVGAENVLTPEEIAEAHAVILACSVAVEMDRFEGKTIIEVPPGPVIKDGMPAIKKAMAARSSENKGGGGQDQKSGFEGSGLEGAGMALQKGLLKHLFTGISYIIALVVAGGILLALSFLWGLDPPEGSLGHTLNILGSAGLGLLVPLMSAYIAYSVGDRPALVPGFIIGYISGDVIGAGFLGAIIGGLMCGYAVKYLKKLKLPKAAEGLKPMLIIPFVTTLVIGLIMYYVLGTPIAWLMTTVADWLQNISTVSGVLMGIVMGVMTAFDMGGPFDKICYTFALGMMDAGLYQPVAITMAVGMTPALGVGLASVLFRSKFPRELRDAGKTAWVLGACFITEGAIPFVAADPLRTWPATMTGSAIAGALSFVFGCALHVPHGGIFAMVIPGAVDNLWLYILAIVIGTVVTALLLGLFKSIGTRKAARS